MFLILKTADEFNFCFQIMRAWKTMKNEDELRPIYRNSTTGQLCRFEIYLWLHQEI